MSFATDIGHEEFVTRIIVGLEDNGTAHNIGIALNHAATVVQHAVGLVKMGHHLPIDVACRLFHAEQHVVNILYSSLQAVFAIAHGFLS